jgi:hypothetical protein
MTKTSSKKKTTATTIASGTNRARSAGFLLLVATLALLATGGLIGQVTATPDIGIRQSPTVSGIGAENSFDRAEYQRHLAIVQHRADGFDAAERARFERLSGEVTMSGLDGFDTAERARFKRLSGEVTMSGLDGFDTAERARFERLSR